MLFQKKNLLLYFFIFFLLIDILLLVSYLKTTNIHFNGFSNILKRPGSCLVLEEENCKLAERIKNPNGEGYIVAFKLKPGSYVFSPIEGYCTTPTFNFKENNKTRGYVGLSLLKSKQYYAKDIEQRFDFLFGEINECRATKKGDLLGKVNSSRFLGKYNLILGITKQEYKNKFLFKEDTNTINNLFSFNEK